MLERISPERVRWGHKLIDFSDNGREVALTFENGTVEIVDILIGADGINSCVREKLFGMDEAVYTGWIAHRAIISGQAAKALGLMSMLSGGLTTGISSVIIWIVRKANSTS